MMEGWKEYKFSEIAEFPPKVKLVKGEEYPFVLMDEVDAGFKYVRASFSKNYNGSGAKFENGDTLFARITPSLENGKIAQIKDIDKPAFGSTEFFVFRGKKDVSDNDFIYYLSKTDWFRQNAVNSMVGASGRQRADAKFVGKTKLFIPPLPTQRKIAKILSAYDDLIENNLKRIKLLEEMAQKTYEEWFVRMKFPGHETAVFDKESGLPEGWKKVKLGEIVNVGRGSSPRPIADQKYFDKGTIPWLKIADATASHIFIYKTKEYVNEYGASFSRKLPAGSLIIAASGTLGFPMFLGVECCIHDGWIYFDGIEKKMKEYFYFNFISLKEYFSAISYGAAIQNINTGILRGSPFVIPTEKTLSLFHNQILSIFKQIQNLQIQNQRLKEARDILLPRLMTGMIDVENI